MGDMADYHLRDDLSIYEAAEEEMLEDEWLTANRRRIPISCMSKHYIKNVIRCLEGHGKSKIPEDWGGKSHIEWIQLFDRELDRRDLNE